MEAKEKAEILVNMFKPYVYPYSGSDFMTVAESEHTKIYYAKICAIAAVEHEYHQLKEQLINLRSCKVIEFENVYLTRLQSLINEEAAVKQEIEKLVAMTPKEKAQILISHFMGLKEFNLKFEKTGWASMNLLMAKECALIAVDEIINSGVLNNEEIYVTMPSYVGYWEEVKQEIEKL